MTVGKRLVIEEYPEQDAHTVDELGLAARRFRMGAYIAGADYLDTRDKLIAALEQAGPGELITPWRGRIYVYTGIGTVEHVGHGACTVEWDCVIASTATAPVVTVDAPTDTTTKAEAATAEAGALADDAWERRDALPTYYVAQVNSAISVFVSTWPKIAAIPITGQETGEETLDAWLQPIEDVRELLAMAAAYPLGSPRLTLGVSTTPSEVAASEVLEDFWRAIRCGILARACEVAVAADYETAQAAEADMVAVADAIGDELPFAVDPDLFNALLDLRASLIATLSQMVARLPRLRALEVPVPMPTIVLAWELYGDRDRAAEIERLNGIANPLFASGALQVLSE